MILSVLKSRAKFKPSISWAKPAPTKMRGTVISTRSIFRNGTCGWALGNLLAICGMLHHIVYPESHRLERHSGPEDRKSSLRMFPLPGSSLSAFAQAAVQLVTSLLQPPPGLMRNPASQSQRERSSRGTWPVSKPALSAPERFCSPLPKETSGRKADGLRSYLVSSSSQQMLGTIRINGLETQVRAIQKLPDYSKNRSPRRKRLIEAQG